MADMGLRLPGVSRRKLVPIQPVRAAGYGLGDYLLGCTIPMSGFAPPPGLYFKDTFFIYNGSASANIKFPVGNIMTLGLDYHLVVEIATNGKTMRRGPKGEKRPADMIGNAVHVMRISAGEIEEAIPAGGKDPTAKALGKKGGTARVPGPWWFEVRKTLIVNERCGRLAETDTAAFRRGLSGLGVREVEVMTLERRQQRL